MKTGKKILAYLAWFLMPLVLFIVLLFAVPLNKQFAYHFIRNDCSNRGSWIHDRVFVNPAPINIAFIGSSHTKSAIKETVLEESLHKGGLTLQAANLGYCRFGRNMDYAIVKDLFKHKKPKILVVEFRVEEERLSHLDYPYIADAGDVLAPVMLFNQDYFKDVYEAGLVRLQYFKQRLLHTLPRMDIDTALHSFTVSNDVVDPGTLRAVKAEKATHHYVPTELENFVNNRYPQQYIKKIKHLADANGCKLYWVFLPSYGDVVPRGLFDYYQQYGTVLLPPAYIFSNLHNWHDDSHLNNFGAIEFSNWMAGELIKRK